MSVDPIVLPANASSGCRQMTDEEKKDLALFDAPARQRVAAAADATTAQVGGRRGAMSTPLHPLPAALLPCPRCLLPHPHLAHPPQVDDCIARYLWTRQLTL